MMTNSQRSAFIGGNVSPQLKQAIMRYVEIRRKGDPKISLSRVVEQALREKLEREGQTIEVEHSEYRGEPLPFAEETVL